MLNGRSYKIKLVALIYVCMTYYLDATILKLGLTIVDDGPS